MFRVLLIAIVGIFLFFTSFAKADQTQLFMSILESPHMSDNAILVAQKSKRKKRKKVTYEYARKLCKDRYGKGNVIRVQIRSDGFIICHVDAFSPSKGGKQNYNK